MALLEKCSPEREAIRPVRSGERQNVVWGQRGGAQRRNERGITTQRHFGEAP